MLLKIPLTLARILYNVYWIFERGLFYLKLVQDIAAAVVFLH